MRVRTPWPAGGNHQCWTSPSTNCRAAARRMCSRASSGLRHGERHAVLKLVAETVGAARLIEGRARPEAAGQGLVEQPAVQQDVHGAIRRLHLHRAERLLPIARDLAMDGVEIGGAIARDQGPRLGGVAGLAEEEDDLGRAIALELDRRLQGRAGIEAGADALRQRDGGAQRGGIVDGAIAADELAAIGGPCRLAAAQVGEGHARRRDACSRDCARTSRRSRRRSR